MAKYQVLCFLLLMSHCLAVSVAGMTMSGNIQVQVSAGVPAKLFKKFHPKVRCHHTPSSTGSRLR